MCEERGAVESEMGENLTVKRVNKRLYVHAIWLGATILHDEIMKSREIIYALFGIPRGLFYLHQSIVMYMPTDDIAAGSLCSSLHTSSPSRRNLILIDYTVLIHIPLSLIRQGVLLC